jgi:hypothetical protein
LGELAYQWGGLGITACRCMDGGEIGGVCRRGGRQHKRGGGRNKRGAVEDWWPVIDRQAGCSSTIIYALCHSLQRGVSLHHRHLEPPLALSSLLFFLSNYEAMAFYLYRALNQQARAAQPTVSCLLQDGIYWNDCIPQWQTRGAASRPPIASHVYGIWCACSRPK